MREDTTGTHYLALPHCASNDCAHKYVLPCEIHLNLAMSCCASDNHGAKLLNSIWPCLPVQVMMDGNTATHFDRASLCKQNVSMCTSYDAKDILGKQNNRLKIAKACFTTRHSTQSCMRRLSSNAQGPEQQFHYGNASVCK